MKTTEQALAQRIRELRRRFFGPRGKGEFARRLGTTPERYERFERGEIPPGDVLVRMCELTGEDLQWLLTGIASRGTVVISGTRTRHQELLTRLARLLEEQPALAAPIEAFVALLTRAPGKRAAPPPELPSPAVGELIQIFEPEELPRRWHAGGEGDGVALLPPPPSLAEADVAGRQPAGLTEPATEYDPGGVRAVELLTVAAGGGRSRHYLRSAGMVRCFPRMFGVRVVDDTMSPMFLGGDVVLTALEAGAQVGRPALCRTEGGVICRIWLGEDEAGVHLGRLADGEIERIERAGVCWSLEVLYRVAAAA